MRGRGAQSHKSMENVPLSPSDRKFADQGWIYSEKAEAVQVSQPPVPARSRYFLSENAALCQKNCIPKRMRYFHCDPQDMRDLLTSIVLHICRFVTLMFLTPTRYNSFFLRITLRSTKLPAHFAKLKSSLMRW